MIHVSATSKFRYFPWYVGEEVHCHRQLFSLNVFDIIDIALR